MNIPELKTEEWIEVLEPFQQEIIKELLLNNSEETAMELWLTVSGPEHTSSVEVEKMIISKHLSKSSIS